MPKHDEHNKKVIGERLNTLLAVKDLKQKDVADLLGVTENTVSYYVTGARCPNTDQIIAIAKKWNVSADYLLGLSDVMSTAQNKKIACEVTGLTEEIVEFLVAAQKQDELCNYVLENNYAVLYPSYKDHKNVTDLFVVNMILSNFVNKGYILSTIKRWVCRYTHFMKGQDKNKDIFNFDDSKVIRNIKKDFPAFAELLENSSSILLTGREAEIYVHEQMKKELGRLLPIIISSEFDEDNRGKTDNSYLETLQKNIKKLENVIRKNEQNTDNDKLDVIFLE